MAERIKTYVENLDGYLKGGLRAGGVYLVEGASGTMKSSLCYYIGYQNAAKEGKNALYITMEQTQTSLQEQMSAMGMDDAGAQGLIMPMDLATMRITTEISAEAWFKLFKTVVSDFKIQTDYSLLVVDSIDSLVDVSGIKHPRGDLFLIFGWLRNLGITALIVSEKSRVGSLASEVEFDAGVLADGILNLSAREEDGGNIQRYMRIVKMRHDRHYNHLLKLRYSKKTFAVDKRDE